MASFMDVLKNRQMRVGGKHDLQNRAVRAMGESEQRGRTAEAEYYNRAREFDPYESVSTAAQGAWMELLPLLSERFGDLNAQNAAVGRLRTGFAGRDEKELFNDATTQLQSRIMQNAMGATQLDLQNLQGIGGYGERTSGRFLDLLSGERDRQLMEEDIKARKSASRWGALGKIAGIGLGFALGGPAGAAAGASVT